MKTFTIQICILSLAILSCNSKKAKEKPDWAKKDIRDFSDADLERLLDQWEEDEELSSIDTTVIEANPSQEPIEGIEVTKEIIKDDIII